MWRRVERNNPLGVNIGATKMTTLNQARQEQGHNWERVARELSMKCREYGEEPLYAHRLWRLRKGHTKPRPYELKALWDCYKLDSYKGE